MNHGRNGLPEYGGCGVDVVVVVLLREGVFGRGGVGVGSIDGSKGAGGGKSEGGGGGGDDCG